MWQAEDDSGGDYDDMQKPHKIRFWGQHRY
jgi:hypothetical protein